MLPLYLFSLWVLPSQGRRAGGHRTLCHLVCENQDYGFFSMEAVIPEFLDCSRFPTPSPRPSALTPNAHL